MNSSALDSADFLDRATLRAALAALGIERFVCSVFERGIAEDPEQDLGFGSLYGRGGQRLLGLLHRLGFDAIAVGPSGQTTLGNPSPYDGTAFVRSHLSISLGALTESPTAPGLFSAAELAIAAQARPPAAGEHRTVYPYAFETQRQLLERGFERFCRSQRASSSTLARRLALFTAQAEPWLLPDALYGILTGVYGSMRPERWQGGEAELDARLYAPRPGEHQRARARIDTLRAAHEHELAQHAFIQLLAHEQHADFLGRLRALGMRLCGDLQAGMSLGDRWAQRAVLLPDYVMGAPPSRTNPEGQPWGYPVLDPDQYVSADGGRGASLQLVAARIAKLLREHDAVRIDHPHALVCPWVYHSNTEDPGAAVRAGARLFSAPDLPDHPRLAKWVIARRADLATRPDVPRYAERWVAHLDEAQVQRYEQAFAVVIDETRRAERNVLDLMCEVLSTLPYPLERVLGRHGLGRFRVTQKADLVNPDDVYRAENARPADWIMVGNHDTPPLLRVIENWERQGQLGARADYLASRLSPDKRRESLAAGLRASPQAIAVAELANLFVGPARNVLVFVFDLIGETEPFNAPGTFGPNNWSLRLPRDLEQVYAHRVRAGLAMNLPLGLALALRARGEPFARAHAGLLGRLEAAADASPFASALLAAPGAALRG